jgi:ribosomal protein L11 methyltransferase
MDAERTMHEEDQTPPGVPLGHRRREYRVPAFDEDPMTAALWAGGAIGCQIEPIAGDTEHLRVIAWFPSDTRRDPDLTAWPSVELLTDTVEAPRDWLAEYRARAQPFAVGAGFLIDPRDPDEGLMDQVDGERKVLRIPARTAFGTGSHETTRLCVAWLEYLAAARGLDSLRILDVGTGSGILALVALRLGARDVVAFDIDPVSVIVARDTARLNGVEPMAAGLTLLATTPEALAPDAVYDLMLVNVLPERIFHAYPSLVARLAPGGRILSSGNLVTRRDELLAHLADLGLACDEEREDGEWTSFLLRRTGAGS